MKTLVLTPEPPLPPTSGSRARVLHLSRQLAAAFDVDVAALGEQEQSPHEPFRLVGLPHERSRFVALARSLRRPYLQALNSSTQLAEFASARRWDTVQAVFVWTVDAARRGGAPVVLDAHDIETEILESLARVESRFLHRLRWGWEARKTARFERAALSSVAAVCATSSRDAEAFERWGARECVVVENGVDTAAVEHALPPNAPIVAYTGYLGYRPNEVAALELIDEVLPRLRTSVDRATVRVIGKDPGRALRERAGPSVRVTGTVPDVVAELRSARVIVLPLRAGSGTRLKVLEAMAAGVPVVSTPYGVSGLDLQPDTHVLLGTSATELADQAARVLKDDALARALSLEARRQMEARYDWSIVARPLIELHARLAGAS
jgi:glycosyltransferase involved in cell wall biosynthesis